MVRPARFEPATYGFEDRTFEFSNLLKLQQHIETIRLIFFTFLLILHILANFGTFFTHGFTHRLMINTDQSAL